MTAPKPAAASSVDQACQTIREAIQSGLYPGGTWIRETVVAEKAKVSRTSVRQALNVLAAEGFVELHPNRGATVVDWTDENLLQVFDLRAILESYGCELAALNRTDDELAALQQEADLFSALVANMPEPDPRLVAESNNRFHRLLLAAGRNQRLASLLVAVVQVPLVKQTFGKYDRAAMQRSASQHQDLVLAIRDRDQQWAQATMRAHILAAKNVIFDKPAPPVAEPAIKTRPRKTSKAKAAPR